MANHNYRTAIDPVDTVFYPVVPDSFMRRDSGNVSRVPMDRIYNASEWPGEIDRRLVSHEDRWSF
ncbi:MAG: hypothetical protein KIT00_01610 [Rhodospirillales bacterium]|nr:hypothetical protein [Rhodospirillales bacterium]